MKKYNLTFLLVVLMSMTSYKSFAYDIAVTNEDGVKIHYVYINDGAELEVVYMKNVINTPFFNSPINIPETVTFQGRDRKVTSIGNNAFEDCYISLLSIPSTVIHIGKDAFNECKIQKLVINDVAKWCNIVFDNIPRWTVEHLLDINSQEITYLEIPDGVTTVMPYVFYTFKGLTGLSIPNTVTTIGDYAFGRCSKISNLKIPNNVTYIGKAAFCALACKDITIPGSVETIDEDAFRYCSLTSVTFSNGIKIIGESAFANCQLYKIEIPASITSIGKSAFYGSNPASITVDENNPIYDSRNCNAIIETATNTLIEGSSRTVIPNTVTAIGYCAFSCSLSSITIPNSITYISDYAFAKDVTKVISEIQEPFPVGLAFTQNTYYNSTLIVPRGTIAKYRETGGWKNFTYIEQSEYEEVDGIKYKITSDTEVEVAHKDDYSGDIVIPETVSFNNKDYKVTSISKGAFWRCVDIKSIQIANSVTRIGRDAFRECTSLIDIYLPDNLTVLDTCVLSGCTSLESIKLPVRLERIELSAINGCSKLKTIEIPEMVSTIGGFAFPRDNSLETVVTSKNLKEIYYYAFNNCISLKTVVLGESVERIGKSAFYSCQSISNIYILNPIPPAINLYFDGLYNKDIGSLTTNNFMDTFDWETYTGATLYVPIGSKEAYQNNDDWGNFKNIVEIDPSGIKKITTDEDIDARYTLNGSRILSPIKGINIIKLKDGTVKKVFIK